MTPGNLNRQQFTQTEFGTSHFGYRNPAQPYQTGVRKANSVARPGVEAASWVSKPSPRKPKKAR